LEKDGEEVEQREAPGERSRRTLKCSPIFLKAAVYPVMNTSDFSSDPENIPLSS
ncbi:uncharacterized, partial [Tachysurus ichikawai]